MIAEINNINFLLLADPLKLSMNLPDTNKAIIIYLQSANI